MRSFVVNFKVLKIKISFHYGTELKLFDIEDYTFTFCVA